MKIAIIGTGNLGTSIAKGLIANKMITSLYLTKRNIDHLKVFESEKDVTITSSNKTAVSQSDILIFTVQPSHFEKILEEVKPLLKDSHTVVSAIAGMSIKRIENSIGNKQAIIRVMPNTAIAVGKSMTCLSGEVKYSNEIKQVESIFKTLGETLLIDEELMQAATVVCASGIAFWMRLIRATTQAAIQLGFEANEAQKLAMFTSEGAAKLLIANEAHPEQEIDKVTTPKGCTIEGLNEMEHKGLSSSLIQGMITSFNKINTIKNETI